MDSIGGKGTVMAKDLQLRVIVSDSRQWSAAKEIVKLVTDLCLSAAKGSVKLKRKGC